MKQSMLYIKVGLKVLGSTTAYVKKSPEKSMKAIAITIKMLESLWTV